MILKLIRWFCGYAFFEVSDGSLEKFLNNIMKNGINIWDIQKSDKKIAAKVLLTNYYKAKCAAQDAGCKFETHTKHGLPIIKNKHKDRLGLIIGPVVFLCIINFMSLYIWKIEIKGNEKISNEEILLTLADYGLSTGSLKNRVNTSAVKHYAMIKLPSISWISINVDGCTARVSIKEKIDSTEVVYNKEPCNQVAVCAGQIERIETYKGVPCVNVGDTVIEGQLLISGIFENHFGGSHFLPADGKVFAKTTKEFLEPLKFSELKAIDSGNIVKKHRIKIFNLEIPLGFNKTLDENYRTEIFANHLKLMNMDLPIILYTEQHFEQICDETVYNFEEALENAKNNAIEFEKNTFEKNKENVKLKNKTEEVFEENGETYLKNCYFCTENICKTEKIVFDQQKIGN